MPEFTLAGAFILFLFIHFFNNHTRKGDEKVMLTIEGRKKNNERRTEMNAPASVILTLVCMSQP